MDGRMDEQTDLTGEWYHANTKGQQVTAGGSYFDESQACLVRVL